MYKETYQQQRFTMFQHIIYEQMIDYNNYVSYYEIKRKKYKKITRIRTNKEIFNYRLKQVNKSIELLNLNCTYAPINNSNNQKHYYFFKRKIDFNINNLTKKQLREYKLEIIFLFLYTNTFLNNYLLEKVFDFNKQETYNALKLLKEVSRENINKKHNSFKFTKNWQKVNKWRSMYLYNITERKGEFMNLHENVTKQLKLYCENLDLRIKPNTPIYFGLTKRNGLLVGVGINLEPFLDFEDLNIYYYETTPFKFLLFHEITTRDIKKYPMLIKLAVIVITNLNTMNIEEHLNLLGITINEYENLLLRNISTVGSDKKYTRKDLFKYFMIDEELTLDFFKKSNLISKIEFEDIDYD